MNLGIVLTEQGKLDEAEQLFRDSISIAPRHVDAKLNLAITLNGLGRQSESESLFRQLVCEFPEAADVLWNYSLNLLLQGKYEAGLPLYENRWEGSPEIKRQKRLFNEPLWLGKESLKNKTILIHAEQGLGDTFQFCRYIRNVKSLGARVIFEVQPALLNVMKTLVGVDVLMPRGETLPAFDFHCPLLSLPLAFETALTNIPAPHHYLFAETARVARWREVLGTSGLKVGISWEGSGAIKGRSIPVTHFDELSDMPGVRLISLRKGTTVADLPEGSKIETLGHELDSEAAFLDTAAVISCCDLVITNDTSIAHLSGALGANTWVALPFVPDWRWLMGRSDSPWYPTVRLFRQSENGNWSSAFNNIKLSLREQMKQFSNLGQGNI